VRNCLTSAIAICPPQICIPQCLSWQSKAAVGNLIVARQLCADSVEKVDIRGVPKFRCRGNISRTAVKFAHPDSQALQRRDNSDLAIPPAKIFETTSMRRKISNQRQMATFSTLSAISCHYHNEKSINYDYELRNEPLSDSGAFWTYESVHFDKWRDLPCRCSSWFWHGRFVLE